MLQPPLEQNTVTLFGLDIDAVPIEAAVNRLHQWIARRNLDCRYVVTPNVDHLVLLRDNPPFQTAYREASLVVADGLPLVLVSRIFGKHIPERVAGSDLVPALFDAADPRRPLRVFLLGAAPGVAERAAQRIECSWPDVRVAGTYSPPLGFEQNQQENLKILERIAYQRPDVLVVGLGAPKQELWVHTHQRQIQASVVFCAGATIDFLAGEKKRAPSWIQKMGLEWCHRMLTDPRRLVPRYARDAWVFPQLVWNEIRGGEGMRR